MLTFAESTVYGIGHVQLSHTFVGKHQVNVLLMSLAGVASIMFQVFILNTAIHHIPMQCILYTGHILCHSDFRFLGVHNLASSLLQFTISVLYVGYGQLLFCLMSEGCS